MYIDIAIPVHCTVYGVRCAARLMRVRKTSSEEGRINRAFWRDRFGHKHREQDQSMVSSGETWVLWLAWSILDVTVRGSLFDASNLS